MLIVIGSLWISTQLPSCSMAAACEASKLLMRYHSISLCYTITHANLHMQIGICSMRNGISSFLLLQLEMEDGDEIDAMLHQTGGTNTCTVFPFV